MNKTWLVLGLIVAIGLGGYGAVKTAHPGSTGPQGPKGESVVGPQGPRGNDGRNGVNGKDGVDAAPVFGSAAGSDFPYPCETHNGAGTCFARAVLRIATSSLASFKTPSSTSTPDYIQCNVASGNTYANTYELGWATSPFATTTSLGKLVIGAGLSGTVIATTTLTASFGGGVDGALPPNTYINFRLGTSTTNTGMTFAPIGSCTAVFNTF